MLRDIHTIYTILTYIEIYVSTKRNIFLSKCNGSFFTYTRTPKKNVQHSLEEHFQES